MQPEELQRARARTDELFRLVRPDTLYERPVPERHRLIFYLGHLEAFDWNQVCRNTFGEASFHPTFDKLFAFGIDPEPGGAPVDQPSDWPKVEEIQRYRERVRAEMDARLADTPEQILHVAIEHRLMHAETFAYLLHNLPFGKKFGPAPPRAPERPAPLNPMLQIPAGSATLGKRRDDGFGWDNEFDQHTVEVPAFRISKYKIPNGQYLEFVRAGAPRPHFWTERGGRYFYRAMFGEIPLPLDWPVYVTHAEATAYSEWRGLALPTEAQFHRAARRARPANIDFARWDPVAVDATPASASAYGVAQLRGNGWEWTSSVFGPFPGFERFPFYPGYSADFFDGRHYVMKGASTRTAAGLLRPSFRNWFRPNYPHVYAGFRVVENPQ